MARSSGFTLLEILVALIIFGFVGATAYRILAGSSQSFSREVSSATVNEGIADVKNLLLDDLSVAGYAGVRPTPPASPGPLSQPIVAVTPNSGTSFTGVTLEGDVTSAGHASRVCYQLSSGSLQRKVVSAGTSCGTTGFDTLVTGVQSFNVSFLNASRTPVAAATVVAALPSPTPSSLHYADVSLTVGSGSVTKTVSGEAALRNW